MMKKVTYLMTLIFAVALMSTSCDPDPIVPDTLETQYPDWANLSWVSTDGLNDFDTYPKLSISIDGNQVTVTQLLWNDLNDVEYPLSTVFTNMTIVGDVVTFSGATGTSDVVGEVEYYEDTHIYLETFGLTTESYEYGLLIN